MTSKLLRRYIQTWYAHWLRRALVDVVDIENGAVMFGYPTGCGNTGYWRFIPQADGSVTVQEGEYRETGDGLDWYDDIGHWPDIDACMMFQFDVLPLAKPVAPRTNYRN